KLPPRRASAKSVETSITPAKIAAKSARIRKRPKRIIETYSPRGRREDGMRRSGRAEGALATCARSADPLRRIWQSAAVVARTGRCCVYASDCMWMEAIGLGLQILPSRRDE